MKRERNVIEFYLFVYKIYKKKRNKKEFSKNCFPFSFDKKKTRNGKTRFHVSGGKSSTKLNFEARIALESCRLGISNYKKH